MPLNSLIYTLRYCRAFTHSSSVFLQRKNIGEVARSDGGVKEKDKKVWLFRLYRKIQSPHKSYMIYEGFL